MVMLKHILAGMADLARFSQPAQIAVGEETQHIPTVAEAMKATKRALIGDRQRLKRDWKRVLRRHG